MFDWLWEHSDTVGIIGVILVLISYYLLNVGKIKSEALSYIILNLIGSTMLLFSLFHTWNLASVVIEVAWVFISLIGLRRYYQLKKLNV